MSVTNYQGMEMIDAEIVELHARIPAAFAENTGAEGGIMLVVERFTKKEERRRCWAHSSRRHPRRREGQKRVVRAVAWVTLGLSVLITLFSVVLPP